MTIFFLSGYIIYKKLIFSVLENVFGVAYNRKKEMGFIYK